MVKEAKREKTPKKVVLTILLSALVVCVTLKPFGSRPGKNGGCHNFASDVSCVPGCRGDSVARHSSFKTWSRLGVGDRLRGSHLDQDQVSLSSQPPVFPGLHVALAKFHPLARMGEISDIVDAVLYLQNATFVTGENIRVDGGVHAGR
jgi:hypothetical protein